MTTGIKIISIFIELPLDIKLIKNKTIYVNKKYEFIIKLSLLYFHYFIKLLFMCVLQSVC